MNLIKSATSLFLSIMLCASTSIIIEGLTNTGQCTDSLMGQGQQMNLLMKLLKISVCQRLVHARGISYSAWFSENQKLDVTQKWLLFCCFCLGKTPA